MPRPIGRSKPKIVAAGHGAPDQVATNASNCASPVGQLPFATMAVRVPQGAFERWRESNPSGSSASQYLSEAMALLDLLKIQQVSVSDVLTMARFVRESRR